MKFFAVLSSLALLAASVSASTCRPATVPDLSKVNVIDNKAFVTIPCEQHGPRHNIALTDANGCAVESIKNVKSISVSEAFRGPPLTHLTQEAMSSGRTITDNFRCTFSAIDVIVEFGDIKEAKNFGLNLNDLLI